MSATPHRQSGMLLEVRPEGLTIPEPPRFHDLEAERLHRKQRLAACLRIFSLHGFDAGIAGHISCRDPILTDHFWVNPLAVHFSRVKVSDLVLVDHDGRIAEGRHPVNAAAFSIHSRIHRARPDVMAAAHSHSLYGTTYASLGQLIPPITQEACVFYQDHTVMQAYNGIASELSEGELIAQTLGGTKAVICRNHGLFTVGHTVEEAVFWFLRMERACEQTLLALAAGRPIEVDDATAKLTAKQIGTPKAGWFGLQPLVDKVLAEQPDLLE
ncbi:MAG: class II aldolase/adducin family protein [Pigmentiphaga sp.]|nr:class II aldolase/adducin family protein [Pigmentiphaga sp.]MDX3907799.1 class II aldolase/adducin family protein [Pigmentiphaga sp.]